ncbi:MAG: 3-beta hydroxysteroid dehydrogenase [Candidatus Synechococcus spongiarum SP3]|uniref:UDP-glucose 4-epimerase n=1 Tax=Candidatus Synechococcus spongiarum SP3 TaxID=1604020 RepID=A0A0G2J4N8_9SYNE|nr:MAG: 3-beta hydroxysteroid dehydrogenase [Candidatus Synechococcus spongiarum SP3]
MDILVMGGTRFIGVALLPRLLAAGHAVTVFSRGKRPVPVEVDHIRGDRQSPEDVRQLAGRRFDVIVDTSGRQLAESQQVIAHTGWPRHRLLYVSSAGVYADSRQWPLTEQAPLDPRSRHAGKAETEAWLRREGIPFTSFRPTYIYGPGNYNPIESWFFARILANRPVPLPGDGQLITQLGHVDDLAEAMARSLEVDTSTNRIYNCSGAMGVTFRGLAAAAAQACGRSPEQVELRSFDPCLLEQKARKAFPLRIAHFFTDINRVCRELAWRPHFDLVTGLKDSYEKDFRQQASQALDWSQDEQLLAQARSLP